MEGSGSEKCKALTAADSLWTSSFATFRFLVRRLLYIYLSKFLSFVVLFASQVVVLTGKEPGTFHKLGIGALAGLIAQSCTYPLEVTRRRMQTHGLVDTYGGVKKVNNKESNVVALIR